MLHEKGNQEMTNRKLIRPQLTEIKHKSHPKVNRKRPGPIEQTNAEEFYYQKQMNAKTPMTVVLYDGEEIDGWIEWYDKNSIKLNRQSKPNLLLMKRHIKYMFKRSKSGS